MNNIILTGPHGAGKTTLLNNLKSLSQFQDWGVCTEITRTLRQQGFAINEKGGEHTQLLVLTAHLQNAYKQQVLMDRSIIDGYVYTTWLYAKKQVSELTYNLACKLFMELIPKYDYIFYIPSEFELTDDGVRSTLKGFHEDIKNLFEETIQAIKTEEVKFPTPVPIYTITGTVEERTEQILNIISKNEQ